MNASRGRKDGHVFAALCPYCARHKKNAYTTTTIQTLIPISCVLIIGFSLRLYFHLIRIPSVLPSADPMMHLRPNRAPSPANYVTLIVQSRDIDVRCIHGRQKLCCGFCLVAGSLTYWRKCRRPSSGFKC